MWRSEGGASREGRKKRRLSIDPSFVSSPLRLPSRLSAMPVATSIMLSSSFLGSRQYISFLPCPLVGRRSISSQRGVRSKWSTLPGERKFSGLGYGREFRLSPDLFLAKRSRAREVRAQAASAFALPAFVLPAIAAVVVALIMVKWLQQKALEIIGRGSPLNASLLPKLTELEKPYRPYPLLWNRHVETIFAAFSRSVPKLTYRRECLTMADGGTIALDWPQPVIQDPKAVLILLVRTPPL